MNIIILFAALFLLSACASAISPERDDVILVRAKLVSTTFLSEPTAEATKDGDIYYCGSLAERYRVLSVLIGHTNQDEIRDTECRTHDLRPGVIYFLIETRKDGVVTPRWSYSDFDGLCVDEEIQKRFAIANEVAALQKDYPCTEHYRRI